MRGCFFSENRKGEGILDNGREKSGLSFRIRVNDAAVIVTFSEKESTGLKELIRGILTEAYEERLQRERLPDAHLL